MAAVRGQNVTGGPAVLAIHGGALGDVLLLGQLAAALAGERGAVRLVARAAAGELLAGLGAADEAIDFDALPLGELFGGEPSRLGELLGTCDGLVSCFGSPPAQGRLRELTRPTRVIFPHVRPPEGYPAHLLDLWAELAGVESVPPPAWAMPDQWRRQARAALADAGAEVKYLLIHPGSGSRDKCWPLERFVELARSLPSHGLARAVFVVGPAELDWWADDRIDALRAEAPLVVSPPLPVLAGLCAGAEAYVGNDSGPTHLAAGVGAPTVAIFGATNPVHFAPRGRDVRLLAAADPAAIGPQKVLSALKKS